MANRDDQRAEANAYWLGVLKGEPFQFEKVEPGDEQILPPRDQRELDALPSLVDRGEPD